MPTSDQAKELISALASTQQALEDLSSRVDKEEETSVFLKAMRERDHAHNVKYNLVVVFDILLSIGMLVGGVFIERNYSNVRDVQESQVSVASSQQIDGAQTRSALCGMMGLFFQSEANIQSSTTRTPEQKQDAADFFTELHKSSDEILHCPKN